MKEDQNQGNKNFQGKAGASSSLLDWNLNGLDDTITGSDWKGAGLGQKADWKQ